MKRRWAVMVVLALLTSVGGYAGVRSQRGSERVECDPYEDAHDLYEVAAPTAQMISEGVYFEDPPWLATLDSLTLVPAEYSVAGTVFLATLLLGLSVQRWRATSERE